MLTECVRDIRPLLGNKSAIHHLMEDGSNIYHCRGPHNPVYFDAGGGALSPIDLATVRDTFSKSVNGLYLRDKNIRSVGIRRDGLKNKYLGIRPDDNQGGSEQLEFTIERIEFDGKEVALDISKHDATRDAVTSDLGNIVVRSTRQGCRQCVKVDHPIKGFKIIFTVHLKGLSAQYRADLDEWWLYGKDGQFRFRLRKPLLLGEDFEPLENGQEWIKAEVVDNGNGTLTYTKTEAPGFDADQLPGVYYIDVDTAYSTTADGYIYMGLTSAWADARNATDGTSSSSSVSYYANAARAGNGTGGNSYGIYRSFFYYNTSLITGTVTAASNFLYGYSASNATASAQNGTQAATLGTGDFDAFTGASYGTVSVVINQYNEISFNVSGLSGINKGGETKICIREYGHDYLDSAPGAGYFYRFGLYYADNTGTDYDPYLSITTEASGPSIKIFVSGLPKTISSSKIMVGGQWKSISSAKVMVGGQWKSC